MRRPKFWAFASDLSRAAMRRCTSPMSAGCRTLLVACSHRLSPYLAGVARSVDALRIARVEGEGDGNHGDETSPVETLSHDLNRR